MHGISKIPFIVGDAPLVFKGGNCNGSVSVLGMTTLDYGYPILGEYGEDAIEINIYYEDGELQKYIAKNGIDITIAHASVGSSRINPTAQNSRRIISFSYDKNFEEYIINHIEIKARVKTISKIEIKSLNQRYNVLIYGVFV